MDKWGIAARDVDPLLLEPGTKFYGVTVEGANQCIYFCELQSDANWLVDALNAWEEREQERLL